MCKSLCCIIAKVSIVPNQGEQIYLDKIERFPAKLQGRGVNNFDLLPFGKLPGVS